MNLDKIIKLLSLYPYLGCSEYIDIAKGKYELKMDRRTIGDNFLRIITRKNKK